MKIVQIMRSMMMTSMMMTSMMKTSMLMTRTMKLTRARSRRGLVPGWVEMEARYWSHKQALESVSYKQDHRLWKIEQLKVPEVLLEPLYRESKEPPLVYLR